MGIQEEEVIGSELEVWGSKGRIVGMTADFTMATSRWA